MLTKFQEVILWLDGKKQKISAICALILGYLMFMGVDAQLVFTILGVINVIFGTTAVITDSAVANTSLPNTFGQAVRDKRSSL